MTDDCPDCLVPLVSARQADPWCPDCEWNLDRPSSEAGWADRVGHRLAWRLAHQPLTTRPVTGTRVALIVASALLLLLVAGLAVLGVWLVLRDFPSWWIVPGLLVLSIAIALRPRLGRLGDDFEEITPDEAPELHALIAAVAAETGAPVPHVVGVTTGFEAYTATVGWRRTTVLAIGLPLWAALDPQERVALLAHELGHFVNGDLRRSLLTQVSMSTLGHLAELLRPTPLDERYGPFAFVAGLLATAVQGFLSRLLFAAHLLLAWLGFRDAQRAEYLADEMSARVAGTAAAVRLSDAVLLETAIDTVIRRASRAQGGGPEWRAAAAKARANMAASMPVLRQLSRREEVSLFAAHPPSGLRAARLEGLPEMPPRVRLTDAWADRIETELAGHIERARRDLALTY